MMRKNNNQNRNNHMKNRNNNGGPRRYHNNAGGGNRSAHDSGNIQRQKHHATQQLGKYGDLARNAQINGDRVDVEYYLQHVEHYSRVLAEIAGIEAERYAHQREQQIIPGGPNDPNAAEYHANNPQENAQECQEPSQQTAGAETEGENQQAISVDAPNGAQPQPRAHQPRPRGPRRQAPVHTADDASSQENADIPLPGSILPPV